MISTYQSPIGQMTLAARGGTLIGVWFDGQKYFGAGIDAANAISLGDAEVLAATRTWLDAYFAGEAPGTLEVPMDGGGSPFRHSVHAILAEIPAGSVRTYGDIARELAEDSGTPASAQAVGGAIGRNPLAVVVPCHRVVASNGSLTGYAGGIARKEWLLRHESVEVHRQANSLTVSVS